MPGLEEAHAGGHVTDALLLIAGFLFAVSLVAAWVFGAVCDRIARRNVERALATHLVTEHGKPVCGAEQWQHVGERGVATCLGCLRDARTWAKDCVPDEPLDHGTPVRTGCGTRFRNEAMRVDLVGQNVAAAIAAAEAGEPERMALLRLSREERTRSEAVLADLLGPIPGEIATTGTQQRPLSQAERDMVRMARERLFGAQRCKACGLTNCPHA